MKNKQLLLAALVFLGLNVVSQTNPCCDYFNTGQNLGVESESFGVALGDLDGDNDRDAVVIDAYDVIEIFLNDGAGNFTFDHSFGDDTWRYGIELADVDTDGDLDLITAGFGSSDGGEVWLNDGSGNFTLSQDDIGQWIGVEEVALAELDGSKGIDMFVPANSSGDSEVWLNNGTGTFIDSGQELDGSSCTEAALADYDGDGDIDAFVARTNNAPNQLWLNDGNGVFINSGQDLGEYRSFGAAAADVDGDGDMDVVTANWQSPSRVWLNDGFGNFIPGAEINNDNYAKSIKIMDHDYDYDPDVFISSYGSPGLQVWINDGTGNFEICYENEGSIYGHDFDVADLNDDMMPDVYLGNFSSSTGDQVFLKETPEMTNESITLCEGDSIYLAGEWQTEPGEYLEALNCDTMVWYALSFTTIDTTVTQNGDTLFAQSGYPNYQWLDCSTMEPIEGATNSWFLPTETGSYAVEITEGQCVQTSNCHTVEIEIINQQLELEAGYAFISSYIIPTEPDVMMICEDLINNETLEFVRNSAGSMLVKIGPNWVNNIGEWNTVEGYLFKMSDVDMLNIAGSLIDPQTSILLSEGYQFISYLPQSPMDALEAMDDVLENLDFIRNSTGNMLQKIGPNWVNNIGDLVPGEGYLVKMNNGDELIYP